MKKAFLLLYLYTHVHGLPQAVHGVSVGLDVAHAQSCHLDPSRIIGHTDGNQEEEEGEGEGGDSRSG